LKREQDYIARRGFAVLHTDYRNHAFSDKDLSIIEEKTPGRSAKYGSDSINAIYAVREAVKNGMKELAGVNPERVGMLGHSMGGGVTMYALVAHPDLIDAAVLYAPVHMNEMYNFERWMKPRLSKDEYANLEKEIGSLTNSGTFIPISPEGYLDRIKTPIQMYWGTADDSCPIEWGRYMSGAFERAGVNLEYTEYRGEGHEYSREWTNFMEGVVEFYREALK
ncbi:alpha/beta fold hydrolase, partial [Candidatus Gracilibacteria bacterium]|nr:alpha/beta fold hydrolase [Candidatus Gracilibacteria bacterium]